MILVSLSQMEKMITTDVADFIEPGGSFTPQNCSPVFNVAIMVAYRYSDFPLPCLLGKDTLCVSQPKLLRLAKVIVE